MITFAAAFASNVLAGPLDAVLDYRGAAMAATIAVADQSAPSSLTAEAINSAPLDAVPAEATTDVEAPDPAIVRLQVLLDRTGASPGVIDGYDGDNVRKAVAALRRMRGLPEGSMVDADLLAQFESVEPVIGHYTVTEEDAAAVVPPIPEDFAEMAERDFLGYESVAELVAERFHMHIDLLAALNPDADYVPGEQLFVAAYGPDVTGEVARIEADKSLRQVRAYDQADRLIAAYPATIGSAQTPSPSGTHTIDAVAPMPNYTYNPTVNFQQGDNTEVLIIPPGPNGPVGSMWIDLSAPTYGIHGTPEPALIDKAASHGCVRLTNWDAEELAGMVEPGVIVEFLE